MVVLTTQVIDIVCKHLDASTCINTFISVTGLIKGILPVPVLIINLVVAFKVRRAATNAAANLGVQSHHHQSTSSSSAVPTVMLVATSLIYVLLYSPTRILELVYYHADSSHEMSVLIFKVSVVASTLAYLVFVYNFYIYMITGKLFRSELHKMFCCCLSFSSFSSSAAATAV